MTRDRVSIKLTDDLRPVGGSTGLQRGSALLVHTTTAVALVLGGTAIQLPLRLAH